MAAAAACQTAAHVAALAEVKSAVSPVVAEAHEDAVVARAAAAAQVDAQAPAGALLAAEAGAVAAPKAAAVAGAVVASFVQVAENFVTARAFRVSRAHHLPVAARRTPRPVAAIPLFVLLNPRHPEQPERFALKANYCLLDLM